MIPNSSAVLATGYATATLLGNVTLCVQSLDGYDVIADRKRNIIYVREGLSPALHRQAIDQGLRALCRGHTIVTDPNGDPAWNRPAVGDYRDYRQRDEPSSPQLRIVRDPEH